jgi:competence protein ComEA
MDKRYYIFFFLTSVFSLALGGLLTGIFFCKDSGENGFSLQNLDKEKTKSNVREDGCDFFVDISGAVNNPGVVCVSEGAIVNDAIQKAGDINVQVHAFKYVAQRVNLARELTKEEKIYIPFHDDVVCNFVEDDAVVKAAKVMERIGLVDSSAKAVMDTEIDSDQKNLVKEKVENVNDRDVPDCININTDSKERIMELRGIGESRAADIILGRPYSKIEDIKNVSGIGDVTYNNIKDFICI